VFGAPSVTSANDFNNLLSVILSYGELILSDLKVGDPLRDDVAEIHKAGARAAELTRQLLMFSRQQVLTPKVVDLNELLCGMDKMLRRLVGEDVELLSLPAASLGRVRVDPGSIEQIHLLLTDVVMPQMSGPALAKLLVALRPNMRVLCMSGYTDDSAVRHAVIDAEVAYLQKPLTVQTLTMAVRGALDSPPSST
jgi:CheY-like chemotaxis protein